METTQKKGMSKGCTVALIVAGILLVIVIIGAVVVAYYWDDLMKFPAKRVVVEMKQSLSEEPVQGVDTVRFNAVADGFLKKLDSDEKLDLQNYRELLLDIQQVASDKKYDSAEVEQIIDGIVQIYPDLAPPSEPMMEMPDTTMIDSSDDAGEN